MKKMFRSVLIVLLAMVMMAGMLTPAFAEEKAKPALKTFVLYDNEGYSRGLGISNMPDNADLVSIKSSKPSVLTAEGTSLYDLCLTAVKAGTSKVTVKYKVGNKTASISAKFTVKKFPNAIKSLKINGESIDLSFNRYDYFAMGYGNQDKNKKMKIDVKTNKGWEVAETYAMLNSSSKRINFKNGKNFNIPKKTMDGEVIILLRNKKGEEFQYSIWI